MSVQITVRRILKQKCKVINTPSLDTGASSVFQIRQYLAILGETRQGLGGALRRG